MREDGAMGGAARWLTMRWCKARMVSLPLSEENMTIGRGSVSDRTATCSSVSREGDSVSTMITSGASAVTASI